MNMEETEKTNKKKMPNTVKDPLVLGLVCLACGGILAVVNAVTEPFIAEEAVKKANQAVYDIVLANGLATSEDQITATAVSWDEGSEHKYLNERKKITVTGD